MASNSSSIVVMIPEPVKNAKAEPFPARTFKRNSKPRRKDKKCLRIEAILRNAEEMEEINFLERMYGELCDPIEPISEPVQSRKRKLEEDSETVEPKKAKKEEKKEEEEEKKEELSPQVSDLLSFFGLLVD
ncbi:unnamed protein product [Bursaphelenchus xylophilus]|uniref:(pine wood nematode) hypothetical protein n=1 Tax=Bursaphelenchus xylophilus TaxID=6326 RepID=A0A7I8XH88_BURXY|nr:unnamed protein product [Bursaphelenchus xylophilus]CAG9079375.1 unnamed protein product [Bursaphelenchus xylophilus]